MFQLGKFYTFPSDTVVGMAQRFDDKDQIVFVNELSDTRLTKLANEYASELSIIPPVSTLGGKQAAYYLRMALASLGLVRTSTMNGAELTGWTTSFGSTGFSIRNNDDDSITWHIVISGKPHLEYEEYEQDDDELHRPLNATSLVPKIQDAFALLDLEPRLIHKTGHQTMWDDDVSFEVITTKPNWLSASQHQQSLR